MEGVGGGDLRLFYFDSKLQIDTIHFIYYTVMGRGVYIGPFFGSGINFGDLLQSNGLKPLFYILYIFLLCICVCIWLTLQMYGGPNIGGKVAIAVCICVC